MNKELINILEGKLYEIEAIEASDNNRPRLINESDSIELFKIERTTNTRYFSGIKDSITPMILEEKKIERREFSEPDDIGNRINDIKTRKIPVNNIIKVRDFKRGKHAKKRRKKKEIR